jgi:hypothetical protein
LSGNHTLSYKMSRTPTDWGNRTIDTNTKDPYDDLLLNNTPTIISGSISPGDTLGNLVDGDAISNVTTSTNNITLQWQSVDSLKSAKALLIASYNLALILQNIQLSGCNDGVSWVPIISLNDVDWKNIWYETKVFGLPSPTNYTYYKIVLQSSAPFSLSEIGLMG